MTNSINIRRHSGLEIMIRVSMLEVWYELCDACISGLLRMELRDVNTAVVHELRHGDIHGQS